MLFKYVIYLFISFNCIACGIPIRHAFDNYLNRIMIPITHYTAQQTHYDADTAE